MKLLTLFHANCILKDAYTDIQKHKGLRLGQSIMNLLPSDTYNSVTTTELDMFYFKDDDVAHRFFLENFVEKKDNV